jgi:hypothetical protein
MVERKMRRLARVESIRESSETYIMSRANHVNNTKIRDDKMDIKVFVQQFKGLEQWNPRMKGVFPMTVQQLAEEVWTAFAVTLPVFQRDVYELDTFLEELVHPHPDLLAVSIFKRRYAFTINECIAEIGDVWVNGAHIRTANLESTDVEAILEGMKLVGLDAYENINYLMAIKRVTGMEQGPIPL